MKSSVEGGGGECGHAHFELVGVTEDEPNMTHTRLTQGLGGRKMSRLHQNRSSKSVKRIDFKLSHLKALQGSPRSGILGEATVSVTSYMSSTAAVPLSIPLNKCNHGTILHATVKCLTRGEKLRVQESRERNYQTKVLSADNHDAAVEPNGPDHSYVPSVESPPTEHLDSNSSPLEVESRATSFCGRGSHHSYNSAEGFAGRGNISQNISSRDDGHSPAGNPDSISSQKKSSLCYVPFYDSSQSNSSSNNSQTMGPWNFSLQEFGASSCGGTSSSKIHLDATEYTVEELRAEAKMWEMNARKLMDDLDKLRTEFSEQSKNLADLRMELSDSIVERDNLKREVEQLKQSLEDPMVKQKALEDSLSQGECAPEVEKALKEELKFQKESYANLSLELKRNQEANLELVSILKELEETIEQQKIEIENISTLSSKFSYLQPEQLEEAKENFKGNGQQQEGALGNKRPDIEGAESTINKAFLDLQMQYESKLSAKEGEILSLKAKLSEFLEERRNMEIVSRNGADADLIREIEILREKVHELEMECNELTDENLELLFKLKKVKNNSRKGVCDDFLPKKLEDQYFVSFNSEVSKDALQVLNLEDMLEGEVTSKIKNDDNISIQELQSMKVAQEIRITELSKEVTDKTSDVANLEANLLSKEKEIGVLQKRQSELEAMVCQLLSEKVQLEEHMEVMLKERDINTKCLYDLQNDLGILSRSMDSYVSANEILRRKSLELESLKHELEHHISDLEQEKRQLAIQKSVLEAQLTDMTNERDSCLSELENSRSHATMLQEEIMKIKSEMGSSIEDLKEKLKVTQYQWSEAQQKCEYLGRGNQKSQTTIENLTKECNSLRKLNGNLRKQKQDLQEHCSAVGARLRESDQRFSDCSDRVELLENKFALMLEDNALKEKSLTSELDVLLDENIRQNEHGQSLLNQILTEKTAEIQNLQQKIEHLSIELSATHHENERIASNATLELSALRADKAKQESAFELVQSEVISTKNEINIIRTDYEQKLQELTTELSAFKSDQEIRMADHEKLMKLVEEYKSRELKVKSTMKALELKLRVSVHERQQLLEESEKLKIQLQQIERFEDEITSLRNELNSTNYEKERLEASLSLTSDSCENLKAEKNSLAAKILTLENAASELEDCRKSKVSLEERLMQMESDLKAKETLFAQETEKKNELSHIKRINRHYQQTIRLLDKEKDEFQAKVRALEEELKLIKEQNQSQVSKTNRNELPAHESLKNSIVKNTSQHRGNRKKPFLRNDRESVPDEQDIYADKHQSEVKTEFGLINGSVHAVEADSISKIEFPDAELIKANMVEDQLNRFQFQGQNNKEAPVKSFANGELVTKERFERTKSMLEAELRDIQERYFHMSLKFAEVEAQREELVMKLKVAKNQKDLTL